MNNGLGLAGAAIAMSLLEVLVQKQLLTSDDLREILTNAALTLAPRQNTADGAAAYDIVAQIAERNR